MSLSTFENQDIFLKKMLEDHKNGLLRNPVFLKYFLWKKGEGCIQDISRGEAYLIIEKAQEKLTLFYEQYPHTLNNLECNTDNDPWQQYRGYGEDKYVVSYLEFIVDELSSLMPLL